MIKNRTAQLMFLTSYCSLAIIAFFASFGLFEAKFESNFYVYFTNISNYICSFIMFMELICVIKRKKDNYIEMSSLLKFMGLIMILVTFLVFNIVLISYRTTEQNFAISSILSHVILPILYVLDWLLFYERRNTKWYYPLMGLAFPFLYVLYIYVRAGIVNGKANLIYPYFFLDIHYLGVMGVIIWLVALLFFITLLGYLLCFIDRLKRKNKYHIFK